MIDSELLHNLLLPAPQRGRFYGVVVAIVTNSDDSTGLGRVKLKFPWLSDDNESDWVRVVSPMAGPNRGIQFLPKPNDEVLVAFEHGSIDRPYVLGSLWNEQDTPPQPYEKDKNNQCTIKSRSGHTIRLNDNNGEEKIEIIDKSGKHQITIDTANNNITISASGDITIGATDGTLTLTGNKIAISADNSIDITASQGINATAKSGNVTIKGTFIDLNP